MPKKKNRIFNYFIYAIIIAIIGIFVFMIIRGFASDSTSISASQMIAKVYDDTDTMDLVFADETLAGNQVIYTVRFGDNQTYDSATKRYGKSVVYSATFIKDFYYTYTDTLNSDTEATTPLTISQATINQIEAIKVAKGFEGSWSSQQYQENPLITWLPTIITVGGTILIVFVLFRVLASAAGGNGAAMEFTKSKARRVDDSKVRFADVAGCDEEKAEMMELVDYLKNPKKYTKCGAKLPKGFLLVGPPGTGKTLLAKAVAGEVGAPFFSMSGSDFVEMFVGAGAARVRDLFKTAKQNAPCVVFIDEIDAVGRQRGAGLGGGNDEREQTLNQLLVELDGFEENSGVLIIAATNRADVLDPALLRAGRFDRQITVNLPNRDGRKAIFEVHARNKQMDESVDFGQLAKRTVGFSGADIANIVNEAAILAVRGNREKITMADIDEAIDRRIAGPAKSNKGMNEKERRQVAYHEAGHAIIGLTLEHAQKVRKITIIPRGQTGGHVLMGPEDDRFLVTKSELEAEICGLLGGRSSEEIFFKDVSTGASNDIERATRIARAMVVEYGMSSLGPIQYEQNTGSVFLGRDYTNSQKNFSAAVAEEVDKEVRKIIETAHAEAVRIINERKDDVILIAETLLVHETISEEEIAYLLENRKLPEEGVSQQQAAREASFSLLKEKENKAEEKSEENTENPQKTN